MSTSAELTKRDTAAIAAMQAIYSCEPLMRAIEARCVRKGMTETVVAVMAVKQADALLAQLGRGDA